MKITRLHAALTCAALLTITGAVTSAQSPLRQQRPGALPPVEAPTVTELPEQPEGVRRFGFRRPILRIAQDYTLRAGDAVRDVRSFMGNVIIEGRVDRDVVVIMGSARMTNTAVIEGSLVVIGGSASIDQGAAIQRDLVVLGGTLSAPPGFSPDGEHVVIGSPWLGDTLKGLVPWVTRGLLWGRLIVPDLAWIWGLVGVFFLVYLALNTVFDRPVAASADVLAERPLSAFMTGLLVLLLTVPALAIIAASVIGLAVVPFVLCAIIVAGLVGKTAVARAIGRSLLRSSSPEGRISAFASFAIGFALLTLAYMVPVLAFVIWALTSVLGLGAATVTFRSFWRSERPAPALAPQPATAASAAAFAPASGPVAPTYEGPPPAAIPAVPLDAPPPRPAFREGLAQYPRATFLDRVAAFALDCLLVAIANALLDMSREEGFFFVLLLGYHIAFWAWKGTTLGGIICSLRVIRTHGAELRFADAVVRGLSGVFSLAALGIGCLWMLQDPERQMWHDKIAGTLVVKVPRDLVLP
jgi:uncharacterized RDD family membrane protein YckC